MTNTTLEGSASRRRTGARRALLGAALALAGALSMTFATTPAAPAAVASAQTAAAAKYHICVDTTNISWGGTNGDVELQIVGTHGQTPWLYLDNNDDNFEAGDHDCFDRWANDVRDITLMRVRYSGEDWHLAHVTVNGKTCWWHNWFPNGVRDLKC